MNEYRRASDTPITNMLFIVFVGWALVFGLLESLKAPRTGAPQSTTTCGWTNTGGWSCKRTQADPTLYKCIDNRLNTWSGTKWEPIPSTKGKPSVYCAGDTEWH